MKKIRWSLSVILISCVIFGVSVAAKQSPMPRAYAYQLPVYAECTGPYVSKKVFGGFSTNSPVMGSFYVYEYDEITEKVFFSLTYDMANGGVFNPYRSHSYAYAFTETYPVGVETCPSLT
ncbi:MAG: hypothetical protein PHP11_06545 [Erysipelotrichaceae bacterium]|nr:hypothetical protein [Erysipelotrichaceae bacterium]